MRRRALHLETLDQAEMLAVRDAWFEEVGGPPPGNKRAQALVQSSWIVCMR